MYELKPNSNLLKCSVYIRLVLPPQLNSFTIQMTNSNYKIQNGNKRGYQRNGDILGFHQNPKSA